MMHEELLALREQWYGRAKGETLETLPIFLQELAQFQHDYNTICYACAAAALAATWAINRTPNGQITGFQAGAIMWEYMGAWNGVQAPAWLLTGEDLLYPQYGYKFTTIPKITWGWLVQAALEKVGKDSEHAAEGVITHWQSICEGKVPFGLTVRDRNL